MQMRLADHVTGKYLHHWNRADGHNTRRAGPRYGSLIFVAGMRQSRGVVSLERLCDPACVMPGGLRNLAPGAHVESTRTL